MPCKWPWPGPDELIFAVLRRAWSLAVVKAKVREDTSCFMVKSSSIQSQTRQAAASLILVFARNKASSKEARTQCVSRIPGRYIRLPCSIHVLSLAMRHQHSLSTLRLCSAHHGRKPLRFDPWVPNFQCPEPLRPRLWAPLAVFLPHTPRNSAHKVFLRTRMSQGLVRNLLSC